jgi:hypothetical protein
MRDKNRYGDTCRRDREEVGRDGRGTWSDGVELELAFLGLNHRRRTGSPTLEREREVGGAMVLRSSRGCERASEEQIEMEGRWAGLKRTRRRCTV